MSRRSLPGSLFGSTVPDRSLGTNWNVPANLFPGGRTQAVTVRLDKPGVSGQSAGISWTSSSKGVQSGKEFEPTVDVYNVFNTNPVLTQNQQLGSTLGTPKRVLQGRLMRLTTQINF